MYRYTIMTSFELYDYVRHKDNFHPEHCENIVKTLWKHCENLPHWHCFVCKDQSLIESSLGLPETYHWYIDIFIINIIIITIVPLDIECCWPLWSSQCTSGKIQKTFTNLLTGTLLSNHFSDSLPLPLGPKGETCPNQ